MTQLAGGTFGQQGQLFRSRPAAGSLPQSVQLPFPTGFYPTNTQGMAVNYRNRHYIANVGSDNVMVDEFYRCNRIGIAAPVQVPTLSASGTGITGSAIVAYAFRDSKTQEWSPLSGVSAAVSLSNQGRKIDNIQTTSNDPRVDQVGVFVSMDGADFRLSTIRQLGVSSITENVATLALGAAFGTSFSRLPRGSKLAVYHDRLIVAGVDDHPDILYVSGAFKPEHWEGLSFRTREGEPITALIPSRDILLVMTPRSAYALRGYTDEDMTLNLIDPGIGAFNQLACVGEYGSDAVVANDQGIFLFNGSFQTMLKDRWQEWQRLYRLFPDAFEKSIAVRDLNEDTYQLYLVASWTAPNLADFDIPDPDGALPKTIVWGVGLRPVMPQITGEYGQPDGFFDVVGRAIGAVGVLSTPGGKRGDVYAGSCDGKLRKKDYGDGVGSKDDDGDTYGKRLWIRSPAYFMGQPGGDKQEGKAFKRLWSYVVSENSAWTLYAKGGGEYAHRQVNADNIDTWWKDDAAASALQAVVTGESGTVYNATFEPLCKRPHKPIKVSGDCLVLEYTALSPYQFIWSGFGGLYGPGKSTRYPVQLINQGS